jgi:hypothetical protein
MTRNSEGSFTDICPFDEILVDDVKNLVIQRLSALSAFYFAYVSSIYYSKIRSLQKTKSFFDTLLENIVQDELFSHVEPLLRDFSFLEKIDAFRDKSRIFALAIRFSKLDFLGACKMQTLEIFRAGGDYEVEMKWSDVIQTSSYYEEDLVRAFAQNQDLSCFQLVDKKLNLTKDHQAYYRLIECATAIDNVALVEEIFVESVQAAGIEKVDYETERIVSCITGCALEHVSLKVLSFLFQKKLIRAQNRVLEYRNTLKSAWSQFTFDVLTQIMVKLKRVEMVEFFGIVGLRYDLSDLMPNILRYSYPSQLLKLSSLRPDCNSWSLQEVSPSNFGRIYRLNELRALETLITRNMIRATDSEKKSISSRMEFDVAENRIPSKKDVESFKRAVRPFGYFTSE